MSLSTALRTGDLAELPSRRDEDWRWTDLRGLIRKIPPAYVYEGTGLAPEIMVEGQAGQIDFYRSPFNANRTVRVSNGMVAGLGLKEPGPLVFDRHDPVIALDVTNAGGGFSVHNRLTVRVPHGLSAVLLESHAGNGDHVVSFDLDIDLEEGASLERIVLVSDHAEAIVVRQSSVTLAATASYAQTVLTTGARRQRLETRIAHPGAQASVRLDGAYLLEAQRHADLTTVVTHGGVDGTTAQLTKGVVRDQARGVFQGRIVVERGADRTDARMRHQALILSEKAEIDAKPELLIFADDVQCAHGNTVGALDEDAIFYAMQRGLPSDRARAMLTAAFVGEVIDRIEHEGARAVALAWAQQQLGEL
ncbi:MAG: SufBD protein [Caulobacter sp.]|nr:SufBD protein [Caulobacter sp.]